VTANITNNLSVLIAVQLLDPLGEIIDAIQYGIFSSGEFYGEGQSAIDVSAG
jgi:hypothetical protein